MSIPSLTIATTLAGVLAGGTTALAFLVDIQGGESLAASSELIARVTIRSVRPRPCGVARGTETCGFLYDADVTERLQGPPFRTITIWSDREFEFEDSVQYVILGFQHGGERIACASLSADHRAKPGGPILPCSDFADIAVSNEMDSYNRIDSVRSGDTTELWVRVDRGNWFTYDYTRTRTEQRGDKTVTLVPWSYMRERIQEWIQPKLPDSPPAKTPKLQQPEH